MEEEEGGGLFLLHYLNRLKSHELEVLALSALALTLFLFILS